jgi:AsmA protein
MAQSSPPRRRRNRLAVAVGVVAAAAAALALALVVLVDQRAVSEQVKQWVLPQAEQRLGRQVEVAQLRVRLFPNPRVVLSEAKILDEGEVPLLGVERAELELALWPLLTSFGRDVRITGIDLYGPELNLIRRKDGTWNFQDLGGDVPPSEREVLIERVSTEGGVVRIIDRTTAHAEATTTLSSLDVTVRNIGPGQRMTLRASAAFASEAQNLQLDASVDSLPASFADLQPGDWPALQGLLSITDARVARLESFLPARMGEVITGGLLDLDAELRTGADGAYEASGSARVDALRMRGEPAEGSFELHARVLPREPHAPRIAVTNLQLRGPGIELGGSGVLQGSPVAVRFDLRGPLLDLGTLLGALPQTPEPTEPQARAGLLPLRVRQTLDAVEMVGTLQLDRVVNGTLTATALDARARLSKGVLTLEEAQADFYDGRVDAAGTRVDLTAPVPNWRLRAHLSNVDLQAASEGLGRAPAALAGRLQAQITLDGRGAQWSEVSQTLTGRGTLEVADGALTSTDLGEQLASALAEGFRASGLKTQARAAQEAEGQTRLGGFAGGFQVRDGWMQLTSPLALELPFGAARLGGRVALTRELSLQGTAAVSPQFFAQALEGTPISPRGPVEVPLSITGTLFEPRLAVPDPAQAASRIARGEAERRGRALESEVKRQGRRRVDDAVRKLLPGGN